MCDRSPRITRTALILTVSTSVLVWADFIKATNRLLVPLDGQLLGQFPVPSDFLYAVGTAFFFLGFLQAPSLGSNSQLIHLRFQLLFFSSSTAHAARTELQSIFMCVLHVGKKGNWQKFQWCKQYHGANSCVWSIGVCYFIPPVQKK